MKVYKMSEEERKKILEKHKEATKNHQTKKDELKKGLQKPEKKEGK
jgi:chlorite dismutase